MGYISREPRPFQGDVSLLGAELIVFATQTADWTDIATDTYGDTRQEPPDSAQPLHEGGGNTDWHHGGHQHRPNNNEFLWLIRPLPSRADAVAIFSTLRELILPTSSRTCTDGLRSRLH
jgi:hypothetical protein